MHLMILFVI